MTEIVNRRRQGLRLLTPSRRELFWGMGQADGSKSPFQMFFKKGLSTRGTGLSARCMCPARLSHKRNRSTRRRRIYCTGQGNKATSSKLLPTITGTRVPFQVIPIQELAKSRISVSTGCTFSKSESTFPALCTRESGRCPLNHLE